ncbi:type IV pilus secretin PilQ [Desulfobacula sp.]|uniref:type IV pilus secretin PilQ n=1 Tax=Desulfobacula sp. TaxID=2593537 RepID=UPI00261D3934|nr:type IV pilus secretin PilQ [Desulfobacula sp.]
MPFFQLQRFSRTLKIAGLLLAVWMVTGCVAQKTETVKTAEQMQPGTSDTPVAVSGVRQITAVDVELQDQSIEVSIKGNQKLVYTSIKQSFPFGIAIYFPETTIADHLSINVPPDNRIGDLTVTYADEEKTTAKLEILLKKDLDYDVTENDTLLKLALFGGVEKLPGSVAEIASPLPSVEAKTLQQSNTSQEKIMIPDTVATLTDIRFNSLENGRSDIVVQTSHPVKYDITQDRKDKLSLNLYRTIIPEYHKRPLLTQYFTSAVENLMPIQVPGNERTAKIEMKIRDQVPYRVVQDQTMLSVFFEPSTVKPPVFTKARKRVISGEQSLAGQVQAEPTGLSENTLADSEKKKTVEQDIFGSQKKYTGEKIKLDFYETDIKNVFRILRSVGGLNFAIDKDVKGKVTLTLEDPVPWDQVLDLVLKMNNLGQKTEGNVIRIATIDTLKKDEKLLQDAIAERKKALDQKKSFEPLVTEYISINYSDADADIKPHIGQILTKDRGIISVDKRTNTVIITDTQKKIDQAREIVYRLDKVTPQIMIEAKVVEVTKNFSRELGLGLSISKTQTAHVGRDRDFNVALNHPISSAINAGSFNFYRILGSNFLNLNAQIAASETKGDVKVVSSPRILTLDNKKAKIKQGLEYPYLERDDTGGSSVKFKNIDLLLEVTPHVTPDKRISMNVFLTKNDIDSITNGVPSLSTNEAETELLVNDNDTIVIGGIVKTTDNKSSSGTPILSGIPILGRLFRTDIDTDKRNELLIFLTPSIVQLEQKRSFVKNQ